MTAWVLICPHDSPRAGYLHLHRRSRIARRRAERVTVGLTRVGFERWVFLAASRGYFKAAGLDLELRAYPSGNQVAQALAGGALDFGVAGYSALAFDLAGQGAIKAVAAQARERRGYEGNAVVASNTAYDHGLRNFADLANKVVAISALGSPMHYQLGQIAQPQRLCARQRHLEAAAIARRHGARGAERRRRCRHPAGALCARPDDREPGQIHRLVFGARRAAARRSVRRQGHDRAAPRHGREIRARLSPRRRRLCRRAVAPRPLRQARDRRQGRCRRRADRVLCLSRRLQRRARGRGGRLFHRSARAASTSPTSRARSPGTRRKGCWPARSMRGRRSISVSPPDPDPPPPAARSAPLPATLTTATML